jgi:Uma2 family endonuclease
VLYNVPLPTKTRLTLERYLAIPEEPPYAEFVDGEMLEKAMPDGFHTTAVQEFAYQFGGLMRRQGGIAGPEGRSVFRTGNHQDFRLPDYSYWGADRPHEDGRYLSPPTLAIEVRSPDESMASQREKCRWFRAHGVSVCWLVDPLSRTIEVFEGDRDGEAAHGMLESSEIPGLAISIVEFFAVLPATNDIA